MTKTSSMLSRITIFDNFHRYFKYLQYSCDTCGKAFRSQGGLKQHMKTTEKCSTIETTEIVQEEVVDHVQAVELLDKDGQRYIKLDDGRLMLVGETIEYTIEDQGHSKVFITE